MEKATDKSALAIRLTGRAGVDSEWRGWVGGGGNAGVRGNNVAVATVGPAQNMRRSRFVRRLRGPIELFQPVSRWGAESVRNTEGGEFSNTSPLISAHGHFLFVTVDIDHPTLNPYAQNGPQDPGTFSRNQA